MVAKQSRSPVFQYKMPAKLSLQEEIEMVGIVGDNYKTQETTLKTNEKIIQNRTKNKEIFDFWDTLHI